MTFCFQFHLNEEGCVITSSYNNNSDNIHKNNNNLKRFPPVFVCISERHFSLLFGLSAPETKRENIQHGFLQREYAVWRRNQEWQLSLELKIHSPLCVVFNHILYEDRCESQAYKQPNGNHKRDYLWWSKYNVV